MDNQLNVEMDHNSCQYHLSTTLRPSYMFSTVSHHSLVVSFPQCARDTTIKRIISLLLLKASGIIAKCLSFHDLLILSSPFLIEYSTKLNTTFIKSTFKLIIIIIQYYSLFLPPFQYERSKIDKFILSERFGE